MDKFQTLHEKDHPEVNVYPNIQPANIPNNAISTAMIADNAVVTAKIVDNAITTAKVADGAITHDKLASSCVDTGNIVSSAVTSGKIASQAVTTAKIADSAVTTAKIADGAVTADKLASSSVTDSKISRTLISITDYFDGNVTTFADACNAFIKLIRDNIVLGMCYSNDGIIAVCYDVRISVDPSFIEIYQLKSGGWAPVATITNNTELTTFLAGLGKEVYLKVIN